MKKVISIITSLALGLLLMVSCKNEEKSSMVLDEVQAPVKTVYAEHVELVNEQKVVMVAGEFLRKETPLMADLPATEAEFVQVGDEVTISFPIQPEKTYEGTVSKIRSTPDVTTNTHPIAIKLKTPTADIPANSRAKVAIKTNDMLTLVSIPRAALASSKGNVGKVYLFGEGKEAMAEVLIYKQDKDRVLVKGGLSKGDQVIIVGADYIQQETTILNK